MEIKQIFLSDLLQLISIMREPSAAVIDLSPIVKAIDVTHCRTFYDFAQAFYSKVIYHFSTHKRKDLIVDRYFRNSLKENVRDERGMGTQLLFDDTTILPSKFQVDFLKNSENKDDLGRYLAKKIIEFHLNQNLV